ncbi:MAG TPA: PAS domain-containing protein, partial [Bacteroidales bacterium]
MNKEIKQNTPPNKPNIPFIAVTAGICLLVLLVIYNFWGKVSQNLIYPEFNIRVGTLIVVILAIVIIYGYSIIRIYRSREQAKKAYGSKSDELERFFANSIDMLCIADIDGYFRRLNPEWTKVLGYEVSDLEGQPFIKYVHPDDV